MYRVVTEEDLAPIVIGAIIRVHKELGPGFREVLYRRSLAIELRNLGLSVEVEKRMKVHYRGQLVGFHRADLLVERRLLVELKARPELRAVDYFQARSYLRALGIRLGLLANFSRLRSDVRRVELTR